MPVTGKTAISWDLPVKSSHPLRAKRHFLGFARKWQTSVTGKTAFSWDLPVKSSHPLRAKRHFLGFARKWQTSVTGKTAIFWDLPVIGRSAANLIKESNQRSQLLPSALHFPKTDSTKKSSFQTKRGFFICC